MTTSAAGTRIELGPDASATGRDAARGWYLYGITRHAPLADVLVDADAGRSSGAGAADAARSTAPLELLECAGLAAIVRPVRLADFDMAVLQERLRSADELETMVRGHNRVIEAVHARQAILPAKFGMVYADARDIVAALRSTCDTLLPQLHRLDGCDEWGLHVWADRAVVRERVASRIPALARLREQHASARPGRAYFLERQFRDQLEAATRQGLVTLAQGVLDRLAGSAAAAQASPVKGGADGAGDVEILRASFLVARDRLDAFEAEVRAACDAGEGLRCEWSGPWPPYSFAVGRAEEAP